ncbi:unnamed protein product [Sphagnum balticum]
MVSAIIEALSEFLRQRTYILRDGNIEGKYVLYWMKNAVRAHENPALDVSLQISAILSLPLLVYQEISEKEPYASDRRFAFEIEGARDVQEEFSKRKIDYLFWIQRYNQPPVLNKLASEAAIVIGEDMPVPSERAAKQRLADASTTPLWLVDTACIVPMKTAGKAYTRAFAYRQATARERSERLKASYEEIEHHPPPLPTGTIDVAKLSLAESCLSDLFSTLEIDHTLKPINDTRGGSVAGYQRWHSFVEQQLPRYARDRNDPLLDPSSRLSPYLRLGHVSPFRIAREAALSGVSGAYKFLDELLVWRELSYTFCRFTPQLETLDAIPPWAVESLRDHEHDRRPHIFSYEELFFAKTNDSLWNAAQLSLLIRGELHNNVRMTWGKAFLKWTNNAEDALAKMISLNHRLALDGNDPSSYGGLLWCLGQFDRPFPPEKPILGLVRDRPTTSHANRLDVEKYLASIQAYSDGRL